MSAYVTISDTRLEPKQYRLKTVLENSAVFGKKGTKTFSLWQASLKIVPSGIKAQVTEWVAVSCMMSDACWVVADLLTLDETETYPITSGQGQGKAIGK